MIIAFLNSFHIANRLRPIMEQKKIRSSKEF